MNDLVRFAQNVQFAVGKKRGRRPVFNSRMFYPYKEELRLRLVTKREFERYISEAYAVAIHGESFSDDMSELLNLGEDLPEQFKSDVNEIAESIGRKVSNVIAESSEMIVGKPYYPPGASDEIFTNWEANFQMLCKSAETDVKKDIARLITQGNNEGWNGKQLERAVMGELPEKYANRASLIARTESAKLNTEVTRATYHQMGVRYYMWMATMDERTRPDHAMMNGLICSVDDPTVYFDETPEGMVEQKRDGTMVHLHPGEDYQCRCTMVMWDPAIDGKYEVKEKPAEAPEEKEPTKLEQAREETAKAAARAEKAEQKAAEAEARLKAEQRRNEILQQANERHARRTPEYIQEIQYERANRVEERAGLIPIVKIDKNFEKLNDNKSLIGYMKKKHGIVINGISNYKTEHVKNTFEGIDTVLNVFKGAKINYVNSFSSKKALMKASVNTYTKNDFKCSVSVSSNFHHKDSDFVYKDSSFHPKNSNARSSAEHEMGHIVNYWIAKSEGDLFQYENIARSIVFDAIKKIDPKSYVYSKQTANAYRLTISAYADREYKFTETIAESFADVFENRSNAAQLSKEIYKIVKERAQMNNI